MMHLPDFVLRPLLRLFIRVTESRPPNLTTGSKGAPYQLRWYVPNVKRFKWGGIYFHKFKHSDDARALHDHEYCSISIMLKGSYVEYMEGERVRVVGKGDVVFRKGSTAHRIGIFGNGSPFALEAWTIFIIGPRYREWGFHCPQGWRHWRDFVSPNDRGEIGPGCGD